MVLSVLGGVGSCGTGPQESPRVWCAEGRGGISRASSLLLEEGKWMLSPVKEGQLVQTLHHKVPTCFTASHLYCSLMLLNPPNRFRSPQEIYPGRCCFQSHAECIQNCNALSEIWISTSAEHGKKLLPARRWLEEFRTEDGGTKQALEQRVHLTGTGQEPTGTSKWPHQLRQGLASAWPCSTVSVWGLRGVLHPL